MLSNYNPNFHNTIHNTLIDSGWSSKTSASSPTSASSHKFVYLNKEPYDEFIFEYNSTKDIMITVPIPFRDSSMAYKKTFSTNNKEIIMEYLKIHLANYDKC
jgi:hypothetical protein